jgi:hypothetical protein
MSLLSSTRGVNTNVPASLPVRRAPGSIAERWALLMLQTLHAEDDPKTISRWAKSIGVSRSALCDCCRLVRVTPHDARDFARVMRAIWRSGDKWQPESMFDLADIRTLRKLLARAGLDTASALVPTTQQFFERQQWIPNDHPGLMILRTILFDHQAHQQSTREVTPKT